VEEAGHSEVVSFGGLEGLESRWLMSTSRLPSDSCMVLDAIKIMLHSRCANTVSGDAHFRRVQMKW
jgi:hypothetical protein